MLNGHIDLLQAWAREGRPVFEVTYLCNDDDPVPKAVRSPVPSALTIRERRGPGGHEFIAYARNDFVMGAFRAVLSHPMKFLRS